MKTLAGWAYRRVPEDPLSDPPGGETTYEWTSPPAPDLPRHYVTRADVLVRPAALTLDR
ncbi:hypothetical protein KRR39_04660 [Nocardioides panacis]|uniref:Uncharacterized protein n=1 Tax=Nocardioides panacis TaxID=2849501 RepID=A0A975T036_9ACTN|nr:hypothetical protein [Nocardioides panacis]QWZ09107.1 hypothetical protein KRR39_04660 [Nocardioides panacis]